MTTPPDSGANLALALEVLTAWRDREFLGDARLRETVDAAARDAGGWGGLVVALASMACGLLEGMDAAASILLTNPKMLSDALVAFVQEQPMTSADVGLDAAAILDRVGKYVASIH